MKTKAIFMLLGALVLAICSAETYAMAGRARRNNTRQRPLFERLDKDGDGVLSRREFKAYEKSQAKKPVRRERVAGDSGPRARRMERRQGVQGQGRGRQMQRRQGMLGQERGRRQYRRRGMRQRRMREGARWGRRQDMAPRMMRLQRRGRQTDRNTDRMRRQRAPGAERWRGEGRRRQETTRPAQPLRLANDRDVMENWDMLAKLGLLEDVRP